MNKEQVYFNIVPITDLQPIIPVGTKIVSVKKLTWETEFRLHESVESEWQKNPYPLGTRIANAFVLDTPKNRELLDRIDELKLEKLDFEYHYNKSYNSLMNSFDKKD